MHARQPVCVADNRSGRMQAAQWQIWLGVENREVDQAERTSQGAARAVDWAGRRKQSGLGKGIRMALRAGGLICGTPVNNFGLHFFILWREYIFQYSQLRRDFLKYKAHP